MANEGKYQKVLEDFMKAREWEDKLEVDTEAGTVSLNTGINIGDQNGRLIIRFSEARDLLDVFVYYDIKCKEAKIEEMKLLMNGIHQRWMFGRFEVFPDGFVRWFHRIDFEGSQPSGLSVQRNIQPGWDAASQFADVIASVALTKQTAEEALADYDEAQNAREEEDASVDVPSEL
jgi:hypothetical protein